MNALNAELGPNEINITIMIIQDKTYARFPFITFISMLKYLYTDWTSRVLCPTELGQKL